MPVLDSNLRYLSAFPVVVVPDLEPAAEWYGAAFGFARLTSGSDGRSEWVHLRRGEGQDLVLRASAHPRLLRVQMLARRPGAASMYIAVDTALEDATDAARRAGAKLVRMRSDETAAALRDPYGYEWALFNRATSTAQPAKHRRLTGVASFRARWRIRLGR